MSQISSKSPILLEGSEIKLIDSGIVISGPLGSITQKVSPIISLSINNDGMLNLSAFSDKRKKNILLNTMHAIIVNAIFGVTKGFERKLNLVGIGYRAQAKKDKLNLSLGFSHMIIYQIPDDVKIETPTQTEIIIKGIDKQKIGQVAAEIRGYRPPEPYKGKGVRYANEIIILKETKKK
ncbi:MAG: 50S ribosomal protein L6 [Burkholderia sp.]|nr:50S ribosomal protein L6 [Burkholderia sp.]